MKYTGFSYTNRGGRPNNEDALSLVCGDGRLVAVLADGLGGHDCGEVVSKIAVDTFSIGLGGHGGDQVGHGGGFEPTSENLLELFHEANGAIREAQGEPGQREMKTTAVALSVRGDCARWAHIGDSRLYHFSADGIRSMTRDHSVSYRKFQGGEISRLDICRDEDRGSLLRVLGNEDCRPEGGEAEVRPGDAFLLCSDGFWENVHDEEMLIDRLKAASPEQWAELMLLRHVRRCAPGGDNFSLITIFAEEST